jgi:hypothetical protein
MEYPTELNLSYYIWILILIWIVTYSYYICFNPHVGWLNMEYPTC